MKALVKDLLRWSYLLQAQDSFHSAFATTDFSISLLVEAFKRKEWYKEYLVIRL